MCGAGDYLDTPESVEWLFKDRYDVLKAHDDDGNTTAIAVFRKGDEHGRVVVIDWEGSSSWPCLDVHVHENGIAGTEGAGSTWVATSDAIRNAVEAGFNL